MLTVRKKAVTEKRQIFADINNKTISFAVKEFIRYVKTLSGETLTRGGKKENCDFIFELWDETKTDNLPHDVSNKCINIKCDGFLAGTCKGKTYIFAREARGILYGAYKLLELQGGIVFATPWNEFIPRTKKFRVLSPLKVYNPEFEIRGIALHNGWFENNIDWLPMLNWITKRGFNCVQFFIESYEERNEKFYSELLKRDILVDAGAHSAFFFLPPKKYLERHPEYYSRKTDGTFIGKHLCYAPSTEKENEYVANIISFLDRHPEVKIIGLWPEDGNGHCECKICAGNLPALVPEFVNRAAKKIAQKYPRIMINHLAYNIYTSPPETLDLCDNFFVNHCDYWDRIINRPINDYRQGSTELHSPEECSEAKKVGIVFRNHKDICEELQQWRRKCKTTIFSYYSDLVMKRAFLTDVSNTIAADIDYYKRVGIAGYIDCCCYPNELSASIFNLFALSYYSWNDKKSRFKLLRFFARGFSGPKTEKSIKRFFDELHNLLNKPSVLGFNTIDLLHRNPHEVAYSAGLSEALAEEAEEEFMEKIAKMTDSLELAERVQGCFLTNINDLKKHLSDLNLRIKTNFQFYLAEAFLNKSETNKARIAMENAIKFHNQHKAVFPNGQKYKFAEDLEKALKERINKKLIALKIIPVGLKNWSEQSDG